MATSKSSVKMSLKWDKFDGALSRGLCELLNDLDLVDVTLACQGHFVKAHKNVLSICSPYFKNIFKEIPSQNPVVVLQGAKISHIHSLLQFMYTGETTVSQGDLTAFLRTAKTLQIKGLSDDEESEPEDNSMTREVHSPGKRKRFKLDREPKMCTIDTPEGPICAEYFQIEQSKAPEEEAVQTEEIHWDDTDVSVDSSNHHPKDRNTDDNEQDLKSGLHPSKNSTVNIADLMGCLLTMDPNSNDHAETVSKIKNRLRVGRLAKQGMTLDLPPDMLEQLKNIDPELASGADQLTRMEELCPGSGLYIDSMTKDILLEKHGLSPYDLFRKLLIHFIPREKLCKMTATGRTNSLHKYAGETEQVPQHVLCGLALFMKQYMIKNADALKNVPDKKMLDLKYINETVGKISANLRKGLFKPKPDKKKEKSTTPKRKLSSTKVSKNENSELEKALLMIGSVEHQEGEILIPAEDKSTDDEASTSKLPDIHILN